jgi:signal transduction histidine kinase
MNRKISDERLLEELEKRFFTTKNSLNQHKELIDQLKVVNKKLEDSEKLKSHFISNITNEIINPFASILGLSKAILQSDKKDWNRVMDMAYLIHSETLVLDFHLKNIFTAAKLEAGDITTQFSTINIKSSFEDIIKDFEFEIKKKEVKVKFEFDVNFEKHGEYSVISDSEKFNLIVSNVISNAIKFCNKKTSIQIFIWKDDNVICFSVENEGDEIPADKQKAIFDRFIRLDNNINSLNRGHGLGLSVTKALIELLEGNIYVESDKNTNKFTINIPEPAIDESDLEGFGDDVFFDNEVF